MKKLATLSPTTALLIIDIQERLMGAMPETARDHVIRQTETLGLLAQSYKSPIWLTEQYPKGLGPTVESLRDIQASAHVFEKTHFDACLDPEFAESMAVLPQSVVVCGMETHICVLSTVASLLATGRRVIVPIDGVLSRTAGNQENGLAQMRSLGAEISNTESIVFSTLEHSKAERFKLFSKRIQ